MLRARDSKYLRSTKPSLPDAVGGALSTKHGTQRSMGLEMIYPIHSIVWNTSIDPPNQPAQLIGMAVPWVASGYCTAKVHVVSLTVPADVCDLQRVKVSRVRLLSRTKDPTRSVKAWFGSKLLLWTRTGGGPCRFRRGLDPNQTFTERVGSLVLIGKTHTLEGRCRIFMF